MERLKAGFARLVKHLPFAIISLPALGYAISATHDLVWPYDIDFCREIAQAQVFADGYWGSEAFYLGVRLWYPPLAPALVAVIARLTDLPIPLIYARAGAYVNFLAPCFLYLLASRCFGRFVAVAAVVDYLYIRPPWIPGWVAGTYAPWLLSGPFAQVCFIGGLLFYHAACARWSRWRGTLAGAFIAFSVLAHASAGLLIVCVVAVAALLQAWSRTSRVAVLRRHAMMLGVCSIVAWPYCALLVGHYWNGVANTAPALWIWSGLRDWNEIPGQLTWSLILVPIGLFVLLVRRRRQLGARLALLWVAFSVGLLLASSIYVIVPVHHLIAYLRASLSLVIGIGAGAVVQYAQRRFPATLWRSSWVSIIASVVVLAFFLPSYPRRRDLWQGRLLSQARADRPNKVGVYEWLRTHGDPRDVVIASDELSMDVVGPAGLKVVAVPSLWASPFIDNEQRRRDRDWMLTALARGDARALCALVLKYRATNVVLARRETPQAAAGVRPLLRRVFDNGKIYVDEIHGCPRSQHERNTSSEKDAEST